MFFVYVGTVGAWLLTIAGAAQYASALHIALTYESAEQRSFFARRYFNEATTGAALDEAVTYFAAGIVLGLLVQIAKNTRPSTNSS